MRYNKYKARVLLLMYASSAVIQCMTPLATYAQGTGSIIHNKASRVSPEDEYEEEIEEEEDIEEETEEEEEEEIGPGGGPGGGPGSDDDDADEDELETPIPDNVKVEVGDVIVSEKVDTTTSGRPRVTEIYSLNNMLGDSFYKPKLSEVNYLAERVLKSGSFAGAYRGFFDYNITEPYKPAGQTSRALEILGYDFLLDTDIYDTEKKKHVYQYTNQVSRTTAIMDVYKALGLELQSIYMYHEKSDYNQFNSPASKEVSGLFQYTISGASNGLDPYKTYVYVTRTDPKLYMRKLYQDFNITDTTDNGQPVSYADFIILCSKMMQFYGEPVMNQDEMYKLIQVYGASVPECVDEEVKQSWLYLKSRGVLNCDITNYSNPIAKQDFFDILMCIKDPSSRTNYKEIQLTYNLSDDLISKGYYPQTVEIQYAAETPVDSVVDYASCESLDYYIPISEYSKFVGISGLELNTMFVSNNKNVTENSMEVMPGSKYIGIEDGYYHFLIPVDPDSKALSEDGYFVIDSPDRSDLPKAIKVEYGGGILTPVESTMNSAIVKFSRKPLPAYSYPDSVDIERLRSANQGGTEDDEELDDPSNESGEIFDPSDLEDETFNDWEGISADLVEKYRVGKPGWIQDESNNKWRYVYKSNNSSEFLQGGAYKLVIGADKVMSDNIYYFDNDGFAQTGWIEDDSHWYYFDTESFKLVFSTNLIIDGIQYRFNRYGQMIESPDDEDINNDDYVWDYLEEISGQWVYDSDSNRWWFMLPDGDFCYDDIYLIKNKIYSFDADGYMRTGWYKYDGDYFYFDEEQGHMLQNTSTPDGYTLDDSGRATSGYSTTFKDNPALWMKQRLARLFEPITVYAAKATTAYPTDGLGTLMYQTNGRRYRVNIYPDMYQDTPKEIENKINNLFVSGSGEIKEKFITTGNPWVLVSTLNGSQILNVLKYKESVNDYQLLQNSMAITNFGVDNSMLVPLTQLIEAGLISGSGITFEDNGETILLNSIGRPEAVWFNGNKEDSVGFGRIILNNKDNTIMVGSTIYRLSDKIELWAALESVDTSEPLNYYDSKGVVHKLDKEIYIDLRAMFGWTANDISFYVSNSNRNNLDNGKQIIITAAGGNILGTYTDNSGNTRQRKVSYLPINFYGSSTNYATYNTMYMKRIEHYTDSGDSVFVLGNSNPIAHYALLISQSAKGASEQTYLVKYLPTALLSANGITPDEIQYNNLKSYLGFAPKISGYSAVVDKISTGTSIKNPGANDMVRGKIYQDPNFGLIYYPPLTSEWENSDGWLKYLKGEYQLPLSVGTPGMGSMLTDMSTPYILNKKWGTTKLSSKSEVKDIMPMLTSMSYFLWKTQGVEGQSINTVVQSDGTSSGAVYYFGQTPLRVVGSGSSAKVIIQGLTDLGNNQVTLEGDTLKPLSVYLVNTASLRVGSYAGKGTSNIYGVFPSVVTYDIAEGNDRDRTNVSYGGASALDRYASYADRSLRGLIAMADDWTNLLILFSLYVLPIFSFTVSVIIMGMAMMGEWKGVRWFCEKVFDPVYLFSLGHRTLEEVRGVKFIKNMIIIAATSSFVMQGNIFRILLFLLEVGGKYLSMVKGL